MSIIIGALSLLVWLHPRWPRFTVVAGAMLLLAGYTAIGWAVAAMGAAWALYRWLGLEWLIMLETQRRLRLKGADRGSVTERH